ncbi:MAG TPA: phosphoribosylglycinamide formyltransferase [Usitatibacter sp.]|nr:phosphoribosylglycinamide formyltransferase [Usitatibacter sp.]
MTKAVILISGRGSNMRSIVEAGTGLDVRAVISNRPNAAGLEWAHAQGIATHVVDHKLHASREDFEAALAKVIDEQAPDLVLLAGFMRILTPGFIARYPRRIVNIHPSLLPSFPGLHTHRQALNAGVKVHGATVHVVTEALDSGPVIVQGVVPVMDGDTEEALAERVLQVEHRIYPQVVRWFVEGRIEFAAGNAVQVRGTGASGDTMISPRNTE